MTYPPVQSTTKNSGVTEGRHPAIWAAIAKREVRLLDGETLVLDHPLQRRCKLQVIEIDSDTPLLPWY